MNRRIPSWIAMAASGVLVAASALAQTQGSAGGENSKPGGTNAATQSQTYTSETKTTRSSHHASGKKMKHTKTSRRTTTTTSTTSSSGTAAARGMNAQMSQCTAKTDRQERAECVRTVWERSHRTS